jgi:hypothetical protein
MKLIAIGSLLSVLISTAAFAQTVAPAAVPHGEDEPQTIVGGRADGQPLVSGWFVSPTFGTTGGEARWPTAPAFAAGSI